MSTCGSSLRHIFESTIQENTSPSSLIDSLSSPWKQIRPVKPHLDHSFTEIFGELHFKENPAHPFYSSPAPWKPSSNNGDGHNERSGYFQGSSYHKRSDSFSSLSSESLQVCTEGLGSESLDYTEDLKVDFPDTWQYHNKNNDDNSNNNDNKNDNGRGKINKSYKMGEKVNFREKRRTNGVTFPPPISCIGKTGKPGVSFQSYREDGRFVLKEVKIPTYERLHASREHGRLRLCLVQPSDQEEDGGDTSEVVDDRGNDDEDEGEQKYVVKKTDEDEGKNK